MQGDQPGGNIIAIGYVMMALAAEQHPFDKITAELTHAAAALQLPDGSWTPNGVSRPPMEDTLVTATAMGARALTLYPVAGGKHQIEEKVRRAQHWLLAVDAHSAEDRAMKLMGLVWTKAPRSDVEAAVRQILGQQGTAADGRSVMEWNRTRTRPESLCTRCTPLVSHPRTAHTSKAFDSCSRINIRTAPGW